MHKIVHNDLELYYSKTGNGDKAILCFHGHGKNHEDFKSWTSFLQEYTVYSFDLFGHGKSAIPEERIPKAPISLEEFKSLISQFLENEQLEKVTLLGYSLGGKMALQVFQEFPEIIEKMLLLAPDGLKEIGWYSKTSNIGWIQRLYKRTIDRPVWFFKFIRVLRFFRILPLGLYKFLQYQFANKQRRIDSYTTWCFYRNLFPVHKKLKMQFEKHPISFQVILGKYDRVIKTKFGDYFRHKVYSNTKIEELPIGHDFFKPKNLDMTQSTIMKSNYL